MDIERWHKLSLAEQMANIGSEVQRAFVWQKRCLEIARLREVLCDYFFTKNSFGNSFENLINYFNAFALKAN